MLLLGTTALSLIATPLIITYAHRKLHSPLPTGAEKAWHLPLGPKLGFG